MSPAAFVAMPGFFRIECGSRATAPDKSVEAWSVAADPDPAGSGRVVWGHGDTLAEALEDWTKKARLHGGEEAR